MFWFHVPFSALSSSVSLTIILSNDSKGLGIVSVISQRTVKKVNGITNNCSHSDDNSSNLQVLPENQRALQVHSLIGRNVQVSF